MSEVLLLLWTEKPLPVEEDLSVSITKTTTLVISLVTFLAVWLFPQ